MNGMFDPYVSPLADLMLLKQQLSNDKVKNQELLDVTEKRIKHLLDVEEEIRSLSERQKNALLKVQQNAETNGDEKLKSENIELVNSLEKQIIELKKLYFINAYRAAFDKILDTAVKLAQIEQDKKVREEELKRIVAETIKAESRVKEANDAAKSAQEEAQLAKKDVEQLKTKIIDGALACIGCKSDKKPDQTK